ncbi:23S rRNA (adenine(2503)-C(2))-methyltransferase RlmN [bacterium]|nr:23S rRNA (adenine(2503)-C(2))-methyltransferase RlmN [bacterium]
MEKLVLKNLSLPELKNWFAELGEPSYRVKQIRDWIYRKGVFDFAAMSNLPAALRERLSETASLRSLETVNSLASERDGSEKILFRLEDGETIESVRMGMESHSTLCLSSQVGCAMGCVFCETGRWGFRRNLKQAEILDQVLELRATLPEDQRYNLVFMGMGEPLQNYATIVSTLRVLTSEEGMGLSPRRITLSTVGLPDRIRKLATEGMKVGLAVSLICGDDDMRRALVPGHVKQTIKPILEAAEYYARVTGRRATLEYVLMAGITDRQKDAERLREITRDRPFKVNIIPYNPGETEVQMLLPGFKAPEELRRPTPAEVEKFVGKLIPAVPAVTVRWSQGTEVGGACGQLRGRDANG